MAAIGHRIGRTKPPLTPERTEAFWSNVEKTDSCWIWTGAKFHGYGAFSLKGKRWSTWKAHRLAFFLTKGKLPRLDLDHLCRNPSCVNPEHLDPVTHAINMARKPINKACPNGHAYTPENKYFRPNGHYYCRICRAESVRRFRRKAGVSSRTH